MLTRRRRDDGRTRVLVDVRPARAVDGHRLARCGDARRFHDATTVARAAPRTHAVVADDGAATAVVYGARRVVHRITFAAWARRAANTADVAGPPSRSLSQPHANSGDTSSLDAASASAASVSSM